MTCTKLSNRSQEPLIQKLYDIMEEHFYVVPKHDRTNEETAGEQPTVETHGPEDPADSDVDDEELAKHLGVSKSCPVTGEAALVARGSEDSLSDSMAGAGCQDLHTGLTEEFQELALHDKEGSPKPESISEPRKEDVVVVTDSPAKKQVFGQDAVKMARIEELRHWVLKSGGYNS